MKSLEGYKYTPPKQEMLPEESVLKDPLPSKEVKEDPYQATVKDLINRYDLIVHLADYICNLIDNNMSNVSVELRSDDYPEVYQSFRRLFPDADDSIITYEQYKQLCGYRMDLVEAGLY